MFTIYLVDDEPFFLNSMIDSELWAETGFEVVGSQTDPREALAAIIKCKPHVVCTDMKMPYLGGLELMRELKSRHVDCEFLLLSGYTDYHSVRSFFVGEGFDYLKKPLDNQDARITLERLFRELVQKHGAQDEFAFDENGVNQQKPLDSIVQYMTDNMKEKLSLNTLSEVFNVSRSSICAHFQKHYHSSFSIILTEIRMTEAKRLIQNTTIPIKKVSEECGYQRHSYFCHVFKEFYEITASEFMQSSRKGE